MATKSNRLGEIYRSRYSDNSKKSRGCRRSYSILQELDDKSRQVNQNTLFATSNIDDKQDSSLMQTSLPKAPGGPR